MRAIVLLIILAVIVVIAAIVTGFINISHLRGSPPELIATRNSVTVKGGQPAAFDVEAGSVKIGSKPATVAVPTLEVRKPGPANTTVVANNTM